MHRLIISMIKLIGLPRNSWPFDNPEADDRALRITVEHLYVQDTLEHCMATRN